MAITHRKGAYADFDPNKMLPAEIAVVRSSDPNAKDGRSIYVAFEAGVVKRMATYEDMVENIRAATDEVAEEIVKQAAAGLIEATESANKAANSANEKASDAQKAASSASSAASSANAAAQQANEAANAANTAAANSRNYEGTLETFPETGRTGILYVDTETGMLYRWEPKSGSYISVGGGSSDNIDVYQRDNVLYISRHPTGESTYSGSYTITPKVTAQTMETAGKNMADDVTINQIPRYDVSNASGITVAIGDDENYGS